MSDSAVEDAIARLTSLRQHQGDGRRAPHKPLLVLLALGQLENQGSSSLEWSVVETRLGALLDEFGPNASGSVPSYPFTRLRSDGVWELSRDVPHDHVGPLRSAPIEGHFTEEVERALKADPAAITTVARSLVESQFPLTLAPDVLTAVGLDPDVVFGSPSAMNTSDVQRRRDARWRHGIMEAWDRSCAFCGYDGSLGGAPVGIEAAHVRWFTFDGPDDLDNGLALCSLHHKLLDRGALGLSEGGSIVVSSRFSAVTEIGRSVYALHGRELRARPGTPYPAQVHVAWHRQEVFKGQPLSA